MLAPLGGVVPAEVMTDVALVISELVTNSLKHSGRTDHQVDVVGLDANRLVAITGECKWGSFDGDDLQKYLDHVHALGDSLLEKMLSLAYFADFTSIYMASLIGVDPENIDSINVLKRELAAAGG